MVPLGRLMGADWVEKGKQGDVGAADKAAIWLVKVQPYQLLVSDT